MLGKFISVDPIMDLADPQQWAPYSYSNNNPTTWTDPTGVLSLRDPVLSPDSIEGPSGVDDDPPTIPPDPKMPEEFDPSEEIQDVLEEAWSAGGDIIDDLRKQYEPSIRSFMEQYLDASKYYRQLLGPASPFMTFEDYCMQNDCVRECWTFYRDGAFWLTVNQTANEELISWAGGVTGGVAGTGAGALIGGAVGTVTLPIVGTIDLGTVGGIAGGAAGAGGGSLVGAAVAAEFNRDIRRRWQEEGWVD